MNPWALREFRALAGLKAVQVAEKAELSPSFYYDIENGRRRVDPDILARIAAVLGVHVGALRAVVCDTDCPCRTWPN